MKFFAVLVVLCAAVALVKAEEAGKEKAKVLALACKEETGATDEDVEAIVNHLPNVSAQGKCLRSCVLKKMEIMSEDGKFHKEGALKVVKALAKDNEERANIGMEIIEKCSAIAVPADHCEAAELLHECIVKEAKDNGWGSLDD